VPDDRNLASQFSYPLLRRRKGTQNVEFADRMIPHVPKLRHAGKAIGREYVRRQRGRGGSSSSPPANSESIAKPIPFHSSEIPAPPPMELKS
jgi:hypothetical protein